MDNVIIGYFRIPISKNYEKIATGERRRELQRVAWRRNRLRTSMGSAAAWAEVIADLVAARGRQVTAASVDRMACCIGLRRRFDPLLLATICDRVEASRRLGSFRMLAGGIVGVMIDVTADETAALRLRVVRCVSVAAAARKVRDREAAAQRRLTKGATPHCQSQAATKPWDDFGISESTWRRRKRRGIL